MAQATAPVLDSTDMPEIRWHVSSKTLIAFKDWVSKPFCPCERAEPHAPCPEIRSSRSLFRIPPGAAAFQCWGA
jgi:hypothetical protein